jgi:hypothetical protein
MGWRHQSCGWFLVMFCVWAGALLVTATRATAAEVAKGTSTDAERKIKNLESYYAKIYAEPLDSTERLPREIAILSLSRIDAEETTKRLLDALKTKDRDPLIVYLAWEALDARVGSLNSEERMRWVTAGLQAANSGGFPGSTATPLLRALAEQPPAGLEADLAKFVTRVIQENDPQDAGGKAALDALADLMGAWHDPILIRAMVSNFARSDWVERVDHALRKLPEAPEGGDVKKLPALWRSWAQQHGQIKAAEAQELKPYAGSSGIFAKADRITDPDDKRWRAELEISKLTVSDFDVAWCIDSTGSMNEANQVIAAEMPSVMRICSLISKRARAGAIYYRHETEAGLMKACCLRAKENSRFYQVKGYPLTADVRTIAAKMAAEPIPKPDPTLGNTHPGCAAHAALHAAMEDMNWSSDKHARRVIVLVGDSPVTPGSEKACEQLGATAKARGYAVHALLRPRSAESWEPLIRAAGGTYTAFTPGVAAAQRPRMAAAGRNGASDEFGQMMAKVVSDSIAGDYKDRVEPLVKILLPYAKAAEVAEQRSRSGGGK